MKRHTLKHNLEAQVQGKKYEPRKTERRRTVGSVQHQRPGATREDKKKQKQRCKEAELNIDHHYVAAAGNVVAKRSPAEIFLVILFVGLWLRVIRYRISL